MYTQKYHSYTVYVPFCLNCYIIWPTFTSAIEKKDNCLRNNIEPFDTVYKYWYIYILYDCCFNNFVYFPVFGESKYEELYFKGGYIMIKLFYRWCECIIVFKVTTLLPPCWKNYNNLSHYTNISIYSVYTYN